MKSIETGTDQDRDSSIVMYPNPSQGHLWIKLQECLNSRLEVFTLDGLVVCKKCLDQGVNEIKLSGMKKGAYVLRITNGSTHVFRQILIQ
jgi:hypothetical protein